MRLGTPFIQLPLFFDAKALAAEVAAIDESHWMPHPQGFPGNSMLPLVAVDGDAANESFAGVMRPTPYLARCAYLQQVLDALGVTLGRTRLMRLSGHAEVKRHADQGYYWADRVRIHVPIVTQPTVRFECADQQVNMAAGECWIFDTWRQHRVLNDAEESRIHLVVDSVGGDRFWEMVRVSRDGVGQTFSTEWVPQFVAPSSAAPNLVFESTNVPQVMTPWELTQRIGMLLGELPPGPTLQTMKQICARFGRHWQALWAAHGESERGFAEYRTVLATYLGDMQRISGPLTLRNELGFFSALMTLVGKVAVLGGAMPAAPEAGSATRRVATTTSTERDHEFLRPVFLVSSPRSGSTLLFETLARAPNVYTVGGESHAVIEVIPELSPARNGLDSNQLTESSATPAVVEQLRARFRAALRDRDGSPAPNDALRMLEKTPKNSLRVRFLQRAFPEGEFLFLYRDVRETLGSMIDAWNSGRFRTYPDLPGWSGLPWSMVLVPGWRELNGQPLAQVVAAQWEITMRLLLDDLERLPPDRLHVARYDTFVAHSDSEIARLCKALGFVWDQPLGQGLPLAKHTLTQPDPDKWRRHSDLIEPLLPRLQPTIERAERLLSGQRSAFEMGDNG